MIITKAPAKTDLPADTALLIDSIDAAIHHLDLTIDVIRSRIDACHALKRKPVRRMNFIFRYWTKTKNDIQR